MQAGRVRPACSAGWRPDPREARARVPHAGVRVGRVDAAAPAPRGPDRVRRRDGARVRARLRYRSGNVRPPAGSRAAASGTCPSCRPPATGFVELARAGERLRLGCVPCRELYGRGTLGRARPDAWRRAAILVRGGLGLSVMRLRRWLQGALLSPRRGQTGSTVRGSWSRVVGCQPTESAGGSRRDASSTTSSNARTHIPTRATRSNAQVERLSAFASARVGLRSARGELKIPVSGVRSPPWPLGLSPPKIMS